MEKTREMTQRDRETRTEPVEQRPAFAPPVDVYENEKEVLVIADLPGVPKESLNVRLDKDQLSIEATPSTYLEKGQQWDFRRRFVMPSGIDAEKITAELGNGVLTLHLPKSEKARPRQIPIKTS